MLPIPKLWMIGGAAMLTMSLTAWGFYERSGKLSAQGLIALLERDVAEQNAALRKLKVESDAKVKQAKRQLERVRAEAARTAAERALLQEIIRKPTPVKQDGTAVGCDEAWDRIERSTP